MSQINSHKAKAVTILAEEVFCESVEELEKNLDMTRQEISDILGMVPFDFINDCRESFSKALITAQSELVKKRFKKLIEGDN